MSNFQWVWRYSSFNLARTDQIFVGGWMKSEVYKENLKTRDELAARIVNSAALIKQEHQDDLSRATHTVAKRVEKCIEADGGIFLTFTVKCLNLLSSLTLQRGVTGTARIQ